MMRRRLAAAVCVPALILVSCSSQPPSAPIAVTAGAAGETSHGPQTALGRVIGKAPPARNGVSSVVVLQPEDTTGLPLPSSPAVMDQMQMSFVPEMLFARTGTPVEFKNSDDEMHNINVREGGTREQAFNAAVPPGSMYAYTFKQDGFYSVSCDVHPSMTAALLVTSTPFATVADAQGNFSFNEVPPGAYLLTAYAGAEPHEKSVVVGSGQTNLQIGIE